MREKELVTSSELHERAPNMILFWKDPHVWPS